ncbi:protein of unknown function [Streptococcus thermophilus]|nr:protein of unknown function [Streptococcus thermophilus]
MKRLALFHSDSPWRAKTNFTISYVSFLFRVKPIYSIYSTQKTLKKLAKYQNSVKFYCSFPLQIKTNQIFKSEAYTYPLFPCFKPSFMLK